MSAPLRSSSQLICLVGLPAVGKTTIGRDLAARLRMAFYDTDRLVEESGCRSIASIFAEEGELGFRQLESDALRRISDGDRCAVVATGGGIVTFERSRQFLAREAFAIYLRSPPERLVGRLTESGQRPMFRSGDVAAMVASLHDQRNALYLSVAQLVVDVAGKVRRDVVTDIVRRLPTDGLSLPD